MMGITTAEVAAAMLSSFYRKWEPRRRPIVACMDCKVMGRSAFRDSALCGPCLQSRWDIPF